MRFTYLAYAACLCLGLTLNHPVASADHKTDQAETIEAPKVKTMRQRAALEDRWLKQRLDSTVPALMRERGIDMWVLIAREYNEDPVVKTMLPSTWLSARRRTILIFHDNGKTVERLAVSRYAVGDFFKAAWDPEQQPDQWARLKEIIIAKNPKKIALNQSSTFALADGMTHSQYGGIKKALGDDLAARFVDDPALAIGWLETRIEAEMKLYPEIVGLAHSIIHQGFSNQVITPGKTTTGDVRWWFRDKIRAHGVVAWFHPSVSIQRKSDSDKGHLAQFTSDDSTVIQRGDLLHVDFGITYMGLNTDTQHHAYVLAKGETDAPDGLKKALAAGNRLQDILTSHYKTGRSGNKVLALTRAAALAEGQEPSIYTHPIGYHGHGAGATIGLWDQQQGVKYRGDYPVRANTAWSIELSSTVSVPEWGGQKVRIMLEEDAFFDGNTVTYIDGRQTHFHLIH